MSKKKVLFVASECSPFSKTGGLADVLGTLPKELSKLDYDVRVFLPFHRATKNKYGAQVEHIAAFTIALGWRNHYVGIERLIENNVTYYFIDNEYYFGGAIYRGGEAEGEQYAFFTRAALESLFVLNFFPDIIHCNDWQTGMIPLLIKSQYTGTELEATKTVFTIHNIMYQGAYNFGFVADILGVDSKYYVPSGIEFNGSANFLKAGLVYSDKITTVSPSYAEELKTPYYSYGMDGILNARGEDVIGILNGIDIDEFNPETDKFIQNQYSASKLSPKAAEKKLLLESMGLTIAQSTPLIGMVSRLTQQKGVDLIMRVFDEIMEEKVGFIMLGSGEEEYENFFREMEHRYKGRVCSYIGYDNSLAHKIYAGADLFLMPSKFEPCGISQMIALRYGCLPIVRETGGLRDTVFPYNEFTGEGNGFTFDNYNAHDMLKVIRMAIATVKDKKVRSTLIKNGMKGDYSFAASAIKYSDLYMEML